MHMTFPGGPRPPAPLRQGARSAGFQPASGQDGRSPRKGEGERPREAHDTVGITRIGRGGRRPGWGSQVRPGRKTHPAARAKFT